MADSRERLLFEIFARDRDASRTFKKVGDSAEKAGDDIEGMGKDAKSLNKQIDDTQKHLRALIAEFDRTGDKTLFKDVRKDRSTLSLLESMRKELRGAKSDGLGFGEVLKSLPAQLKGAAIVGIGGAAVAAAPAVGAAIGGAVLGGVGVGGIVGGVVAASSDPRVKTAGAELGDHFLSSFKDAGSPFIAPLLAEFGTLRRAGDSLTGELEDGFKKLAPLLRPLAHGVEGFVDAFGPGLSDAFSAAQPAIRALAHELPEVGDALSDMLHAISEEGDGATEGLLSLLHATEFLTRTTGDFIGQLEFEYKHLVALGAKLDEFKEKVPETSLIFGGGFALMTDEAADLKSGLADATSANGDFYLSALDTARALEDGTEAARDLKIAFDDLFGKQMSLDQAQLKYKKSLDDTLEALKDGKRTLDENTEAGQENVSAVLDMIRSIEDLRSANVNNGMTVADANKVYDTQLNKLRDTLLSLGFNKKAVDELVGAYKKIPAEVATKVSTSGLDAAYRRLMAYVELLGDAEGHRRAEFAGYREGERNPSANIAGARASGGPVKAGQTYMVGENGPELVTFGADGTVIPNRPSAAMMSGTGAPMKVELTVRYAGPGGATGNLAEALMTMLRYEVRVQGGGVVQDALGEERFTDLVRKSQR